VGSGVTVGSGVGVGVGVGVTVIAVNIVKVIEYVNVESSGAVAVTEIV
jgi:hypothetical protein